jgi:DNA-binding PadR family transcriptional regulator
MIIDGKAFTGKNFERKIGREKFSIFLLWMISKKEQHGYEIIKTIEEDPVIPSFAANKIYPLLRELHKKELITQKKVMQGKRPRKVYSITAKGKAVLQKAKEYIKESPLMMQYVEDMCKYD